FDGGTISRGWSLSIETDDTAPVTTASLNPPANSLGWTKADTTVTLTATDPGGTGVQQITYSATGAFPFAPTSTLGAVATVNISTEGITTLSFAATDNAGNVEPTQTLRVKLDKTKPTMTRGPTAKFVAVTTVLSA